jgi:hypothetical protein
MTRFMVMIKLHKIFHSLSNSLVKKVINKHMYVFINKINLTQVRRLMNELKVFINRELINETFES